MQCMMGSGGGGNRRRRSSSGFCQEEGQLLDTDTLTNTLKLTITTFNKIACTQSSRTVS